MSIVELTNTELEQYGRSIEQIMPFFKHLSDFAENPNNKQFYIECMNETTLPATLFYLWLYKNIEKYDSTLSPGEKVAICHKIIHTPYIHDDLYTIYNSNDEIQDIQKYIKSD